MQPRKVADGLLAVTLPLPFELNHINVYLVALDRGWMLVDCGLASDASFQALEEGLATLGVAFGDIRRILITHSHPDHMGNAPKLIERTGAELLMNPDEAALLSEVAEGEDRPPWLDQVLREAAVPAAMVAGIDNAFRKYRKVFHPLQPDRLLTGGERIPTALGDLEVICTPGHSPGHLCLYSHDRRLLLSGDHLLPGITPNIGWLPGRDMLAEYLQSLDRVDPYPAEKIIPSHGQPFEDHRSWIVDTKRHHEDRCARILESTAQSPRTSHQLVRDLWNYPLSAFNHRFAIFEVLAHLVYLERQGRVTKYRENGAVLWRA
ncbi:MAG: MBL fold metallo-hydrolase [Bryobacteraceae bacterium]